MWELTCVASVYRRRSWCRGDPIQGGPRAERAFRCPLPETFRESTVSSALAALVPDVERWLVESHADLVNDVVITVYSIEVCNAPAVDDSGV